MEPILLPNKIEIKKGKEPHSAEFVLSPCYQGYGTTIGNALRRVLLSSISGAAVTAIKIKNVDHEFSTVPNVKEDVVQIILNLKQLRLKIHTDEPVRLHLYAKGERKVTAKDIEPNAQVEIINKDLHLAEITGENAEFDMDIFAEQGRGYLTVEERSKSGLEIGTIAIDAVYTPIKSVGFKVEPVRVGQITNFDALNLNIETDGSVSPEEAIKQAAKILIQHFTFVETMGKSLEKEEAVSPELTQNLTALSEMSTLKTEEEPAVEKGEEEPIKKPAKRKTKKSEKSE
ncbi:MAG: DNA-directed RNA polymerase subunit alpha [bacterium]|nr:DNA-directed RNA polymerase subunit alpha [bacterium]